MSLKQMTAEAGTTIVVRVHNVGQGNAISVVAKKDGQERVLLYNDFGGMGRTHPCYDDYDEAAVKGLLPVQLPNQTDFPTVMMSHWDKDHYYSGTKLEEIRQKCRWLGPRQAVGGQCVRFVNSLTTTGDKTGTLNVGLWAQDKRGTAEGRKFKIGALDVYVYVERCDGNATDRNLDGLMIAVIDDTGGYGHWILLPGDAPYQVSESLRDEKSRPSGTLKGLVAYHHGAESHWTGKTPGCLPDDCAQTTLVFSYGAGNSYGHPRKGKYPITRWKGSILETKGKTNATTRFVEIELN